jgi:hypothetical protein
MLVLSSIKLTMLAFETDRHLDLLDLAVIRKGSLVRSVSQQHRQQIHCELKGIQQKGNRDLSWRCHSKLYSCSLMNASARAVAQTTCWVSLHLVGDERLHLLHRGRWGGEFADSNDDARKRGADHSQGREGAHGELHG